MKKDIHPKYNEEAKVKNVVSEERESEKDECNSRDLARSVKKKPPSFSSNHLFSFRPLLSTPTVSSFLLARKRRISTPRSLFTPNERNNGDQTHARTPSPRTGLLQRRGGPHRQRLQARVRRRRLVGQPPLLHRRPDHQRGRGVAHRAVPEEVRRAVRSRGAGVGGREHEADIQEARREEEEEVRNEGEEFSE